MNRKILWVGVSFLLVAALVLASCGPKEEVVKKGELYGGTLNIYSRGGAEPASPSESDSQWIATFFLMPIQETVLQGDIEKYGPRGTGEYAFQTSGYLPMQYLTGRLLEDWEITPDSVILHVRPGIHWAPTEAQRAWMEPRELTAEDIAADLNRFREAPWGNRFDGVLKDVYTTDKYTVVVEFVDQFSLEGFYYFGWEDRSLIAPPEMIEAGDDRWANQVGTGPFMFEEYVPGSHMSYVRNPDYWGTTTINGKEYQMPFIDRLIYPIIPDEATQIAALRTAKIDFHQFVPPSYWDNLDTIPELEKARYSNSDMLLSLLVKEPPFNDVNVRQAMMIGTDLKAHKRLVFAEELPTHSYPIHFDNPAYIPLEQLPADLQALYDYNPDKAKQMLADAGYPNGFIVDIYCDTTPTHQDNAALLKDEWSKFGVTANIQAHDPVTHTDFTYHRNYKGCALNGEEITNPINSLYRFGHTEGYINFPGYSNPEYDAVVEELAAELDPEKQLPLMKEASLILLRDCPHIPLYASISGHYWWPWIKNYYGEVTATDGGVASILHYCWVDQDLKTELGH